MGTNPGFGEVFITKNYVGTAAPLSGRAKLDLHSAEKNSGASLRRTAEGGCPHVVHGDL